MLSFRRQRNEALLIERYWSSLRRDNATPLPDALDSELGRVVAEVERDLRPPQLTDTSIEQIWRRVEARAPETIRSGWSGPAIDPTARRRTGAPPLNEREEQQSMSDHTRAADIEPIPLQQRRWLRETLKFVAAALVFIIIGAVLALTLRGDDDQTPAIGPSGPTPTPTIEATATEAAVVPAPTELAATATSEPAATATAPPSPTVSLPSFGTIAATIQVGTAPRSMAVGEGSAWVTNADDGTVSRIDLETNEVVATIQVAPAGQVAVDAIAVGSGAVWVTTQGSIQLARIDPATNQVVTTFSLNTAVHELVFGGDALWGRGSFSNTIVRVDPATNTVVASIDVPPPFAIAYLDGALWSVSEATATKIDAATNTVVATVPIDAPTFTVAAAGGSLWLAPNSPSPELIQIDPASATVSARHPLPEQLVDIVITGSSDAIYICPCRTESEAVVWRFDIASQELDAMLDVPDAQWIAYLADALWSVSQANGVVTRVEVTS